MDLMHLVDQHPDALVERYLESDVFNAIELVNSRFSSLEAVITRFEAIDRFNNLGNVEYYGASTAFGGLSYSIVAVPPVGGTASFSVTPLKNVDVCLFVVGQPVRCVATPSAYFEGTVTGYTSEGVVSVVADVVVGSGTYSAWSVVAIGSKGAKGDKGEAGWSNDADNIITTGTDGKALLTAAAVRGFAGRSPINVTASNLPSLSTLPDSLYAYTQPYTSSAGFTVTGCPLTAANSTSAQYSWQPSSNLVKTGVVRWSFTKGTATTVYRADVVNGAFTTPFTREGASRTSCPSYALDASDYISDFTGTANMSAGVTSALVAAASCGKPLWFPSSSTVLLTTRVSVTLVSGASLSIEGNGCIFKYPAALSLATSSSAAVLDISGVCDSVSVSDVVFFPYGSSVASFGVAIGNSTAPFNTGTVTVSNVRFNTAECTYNIFALRNCSRVTVTDCSFSFTELRVYSSAAGSDYLIRSSTVGMLRVYTGSNVRFRQFKVTECLFKDYPHQTSTDFAATAVFCSFSRLNSNTALAYFSDIVFNACEFSSVGSSYKTIEGIHVIGQDSQITGVQLLQTLFTGLTGKLLYIPQHIPSSVVIGTLPPAGVIVSGITIRSHNTTTQTPPIRLQGCIAPQLSDIFAYNCTGTGNLTSVTRPPIISLGNCYSPIIDTVVLSNCSGYSRIIYLDSCLLSVIRGVSLVDSPQISTVPLLNGSSTVSGSINSFLVNARTNTGAVTATTDATSKVLPQASTNLVTYIDGTSPQLFDATTGIYTVPLSGVYTFSLDGLAQCFGSPSEYFAFVVNDVVTGATSRSMFTAFSPLSLRLTKYLYAGDKVAVKFLGRDEEQSVWRLTKLPPVGVLAPAGLHFTGCRIGDTYVLPSA